MSQPNRQHEPYQIVEFPGPFDSDSVSDPSHDWVAAVIEYGTLESATFEAFDGDVLVLNESVGEPVRLLIHGLAIAEGVLIQEQNRLGIRIEKLLTENDHDQNREAA